MPSWMNRLLGGKARVAREEKSFAGASMMTLSPLGAPSWTGRGYASLINQGFMRNPVVYRCVRLIAETANRVPLDVQVDGKAEPDHPLAHLLRRPNGRQSGPEMTEALYAYLQTAGNAYLQAGIVDGVVRTLFVLRPDRMSVVTGRDGWPVAYDYKAGGKAVRLSQETAPIPSVLHLALFIRLMIIMAWGRLRRRRPVSTFTTPVRSGTRRCSIMPRARAERWFITPAAKRSAPNAWGSWESSAPS